MGVKPRFPAWLKGIMPPRQVLKVTKGDSFSIFSAEGDDPRTAATSPRADGASTVRREMGLVCGEHHHDNIVRLFYRPVKVTRRSDKEE